MTAREMVAGNVGSEVRSCAWVYHQSWPHDPSDLVFPARAFNEIGRSHYGNKWSDSDWKDVAAERNWELEWDDEHEPELTDADEKCAQVIAFNASGRLNASNNNRSKQKNICRFASCYLLPELEGRYFGLFDGRRAHGAGRR
jgi:hypothetical protein